MAIGKAASKHINKISQLTQGEEYVDIKEKQPYGEPTRGTKNVDLTESEVLDADIAQAVADERSLTGTRSVSDESSEEQQSIQDSFDLA